MLADDSTVKTSWPSLMDKRNSSSMSLGNMAAGSQLSRLPDAQAPASSLAFQKKDASGSDSQSTQAGVTVARKRRVHAQVSAFVIFKTLYLKNGCPYLFLLQYGLTRF